MDNANLIPVDNSRTKVRFELKPNHREIPDNEPLYLQIPYCDLQRQVKQASLKESTLLSDLEIA
jgi:hypothetical protein